MKIIIADDHQIFRQGLVKQIEGSDDFSIIGEASNGNEAFDLIKKLKPDMALLDINMPGKNGLEIAQESIKEGYQTDFVILTMYTDEEYLNKALDIGVKGYLLKENSFEDLIACLKAVTEGKHFISPLLSGYMVNRHGKLSHLKEKAPALRNLTATEKKILKFIAQYKPSKEIADEMCVSPRTVDNHRANISMKLNISGKNKLLKFALEHKSLLGS